MLTHAAMKGLAFLAAGCLLFALRLSRGDVNPLTSADLAGAARRYPVIAIAFSIALLGLGGLPPLGGFMSKWQIFAAGVRSGNPIAIALVVFAVLNSLLSLGYYAPLVSMMYRNEPSEVVVAGAQSAGCHGRSAGDSGAAVIASSESGPPLPTASRCPRDGLCSTSSRGREGCKMPIAFSPPVAFAVYILLAGILLAVAQAMAAKGKASVDKTSMYGSGENGSPSGAPPATSPSSWWPSSLRSSTSAC